MILYLFEYYLKVIKFHANIDESEDQYLTCLFSYITYGSSLEQDTMWLLYCMTIESDLLIRHSPLVTIDIFFSRKPVVLDQEPDMKCPSWEYCSKFIT